MTSSLPSTPSHPTAASVLLLLLRRPRFQFCGLMTYASAVQQYEVQCSIDGFTDSVDFNVALIVQWHCTSRYQLIKAGPIQPLT